MLRVVGAVALIVLAACGPSNIGTASSPSPVIPQGTWTQNLTFSGELAGQMTAIAANSTTQQSECTGSRTRNGETWSDSFWGTVDSGGDQWGVVFLISNFRGPGTYGNADVNIQLHSLDNSKVWQNFGGDKITFTIERGQQSGSIDALLTDAASGKSGAEHIAGRWNCRG